MTKSVKIVFPILLAGLTACERPRPEATRAAETAPPAEWKVAGTNPIEADGGRGATGGIKVVVLNPNTGESAETNIPPGPGAEDQLRAAFGAPPKAVEEATKQYLPRAEVLKFKGKVKCRYLVYFNTWGRLDPEGEVSDGIAYDAFTAPVLEKLPNGYFKTVRRARPYDDAERAKNGDYTVVYFRAEKFTSDWRKTDWATNSVSDGGGYGESDVPELCPTPAAGRKKGGKNKK